MVLDNLSEYEQNLVDSWEATYKQGQLTMWVLLSLYESPKTLPAIRAYLQEASQGTMKADDKSLYRSLRRYYAAEMVNFVDQPSKNGGPPTKLYSLSEIGLRVLHQFIHRNLSVQQENKQIKEILRNGN